jgi:DNA-binding MarR family transcriptional regulator
MNGVWKIASVAVMLMLSVAVTPAYAFSPASGMTQQHPENTGQRMPECTVACGTPARRPDLPLVRDGSGRVSGIRRIYPKNVLDLPERAAIYSLVQANPGIDIEEIAAKLAMNRHTLRYHIELMESCSKIIVMRNLGIVRYYANNGKHAPLERQVMNHLWNPTAKRILAIIASQPGVTPTWIGTDLGITTPTVRWYIQRFADDGILTRQHEGRFTRYSLTPGAREVLGREIVSLEARPAVALA